VGSIYYNQAICEALREEMSRDKRVFLLGEDIGKYGGVYRATLGLLEEFGEERVRDTPISEAAICGAAIGAAITGMKPVIEIMYIDFIPIAMGQIVNQATQISYIYGGQVKVPLVIRTQGGAGASAGAQHSKSLEAWFTHVPGLKVVMPSTPYDVKGLLKAAIRDPGPVIFIEHKLLYGKKGHVPEQEYIIELGVADIKRIGKDITVIATSRMVLESLEAAEELEKEGISVEVIDPRTLVPLDTKTLFNSVKKTGRVVIVHEAWKRGGFGAEIVAEIVENCFDFLKTPIKRVAGKEVPIPYSPELEKLAIPNKEEIIQAIKENLNLVNK
jgi:pyruvate dehydrogenase E1 component beta subunit